MSDNRFESFDRYVKSIQKPKARSRQFAVSSTGARSFGGPKWSISQTGIDLIKGFEGFRAQMYNDQAGHCTIGYGTLIHQGNCNGDASEKPYGSGITESRAMELLKERLVGFEQTINDVVTVDLNQNQYDSLVSFTYNVGSANFKSSTLLKVLNQGKYGDVPTEMHKWVKVRQNGKLVDSKGLMNRRDAEAKLFASSTTSSSQSIIELARPFYDTGEHSILGSYVNDLLTGPLSGVGPVQPTTTYSINGVSFTYGQIMTMGDFYDTYDDLAKAPAAELTKVKTLVQKDEVHYRNTVLGIGSGGPSVKNSEWGSSAGIGSRFMDLALKNYAHFSPTISSFKTSTDSNKLMWQRYHSRAIAMARAGTNSSALPPAYMVNAFGDHFLTDAFSAGHLINKDEVMQRFLSAVTTGGKANDAGKKLLKQIADRSLSNKIIKPKLALYELTETHLGVHMNLDTTFPADIFYEVLKGILEDTAHEGNKQIANLAVKVIHDYLNNYSGGLPVSNNKGQNWNLTGDGTLNKDNVKMIQQAVKQSVLNIEDAVREPSTSLSTFYDRVWDYVPRMNVNPPKNIIDAAVTNYTNPTYPDLLTKAIELLEKDVDTLITALLDAKKIRLA